MAAIVAHWRFTLVHASGSYAEFMEDKMRIWLMALACASVCTPLAAPAAAAQSDGNRIPTRGVFFNNTEVSKILYALARITKTNIVVPSDIKTQVTVRLADVTADQAIRTIAGQAGLAYRKIGTTYFIAKPENMKSVLEQNGVEERATLHSLATDVAVTELQKSLPYLTVRPAGRSVILIGSADDIEQARLTLQELENPQNKEAIERATLSRPPITADVLVKTLSGFQVTSTKLTESTILVTGTRSEVTRASQFVNSLAVAKEPTARYVVYKVKYSSARALSDSLQAALTGLSVTLGPEPFRIPRTQLNLTTGQAIGGSSGGAGGSSGGSGGGFGGSGSSGGGSSDQGAQTTVIPNGRNTRTLILGGTDEQIKAAIDLLSKIDVPAPQVQLDVKVVSTSPQTSQNLGILWQNSAGGDFSVSTTVQEGPVGSNPIGSTLRNGFGLGSFARLPISFNAQLNAFFQRTDVRILAKPSITSLDNEEGVIFVGETRRIQVFNIVPGVNSNTLAGTIVEIPVGIILQMQPRVGEDDMISLRVHPILSTANGNVAAGALFNTIVREAETSVRLKSGETLVIGGLLQDEDTRTLTKVPILGDIPVIGQFFRNHQRQHTRTEVLVFVTPHLVKD